MILLEIFKLRRRNAYEDEHVDLVVIKHDLLSCFLCSGHKTAGETCTNEKAPLNRLFQWGPGIFALADNVHTAVFTPFTCLAAA